MVFIISRVADTRPPGVSRNNNYRIGFSLSLFNNSINMSGITAVTVPSTCRYRQLEAGFSMGVFSANTGATSGLINSINIKAIVVIDMETFTSHNTIIPSILEKHASYHLTQGLSF